MTTILSYIKILQVHTVRMNKRLFNEFLEDVHAEEMRSYAATTAGALDEQPGTQDEHDGIHVDDGTGSDLSMEVVHDTLKMSKTKSDRGDGAKVYLTRTQALKYACSTLMEGPQILVLRLSA